MATLAEFLADEVARTSYRAVQDKTGVSRGALEKIIKRTNKQSPELDTLYRISQAYDIPLWRVIEMTGYDLGFAPYLIGPKAEEARPAVAALL